METKNYNRYNSKFYGVNILPFELSGEKEILIHLKDLESALLPKKLVKLATNTLFSTYNTYEYVNVQVDNMLDLTDDVVRQQLGVDFDLLTRTSSNLDEAYDFTHEIGTWAASKGYSGLIVPGARGNKNYVNTIIFNQVDVNAALGSITPTIITN